MDALAVSAPPFEQSPTHRRELPVSPDVNPSAIVPAVVGVRPRVAGRAGMVDGTGRCRPVVVACLAALALAAVVVILTSALVSATAQPGPVPTPVPQTSPGVPTGG